MVFTYKEGGSQVPRSYVTARPQTQELQRASSMAGGGGVPWGQWVGLVTFCFLPLHPIELSARPPSPSLSLR